MHSHTFGDLIAPVSLGVSGVALIALALCFADADLADFDPRPAARTAHQAAVHAGHDLNRAYATTIRHARDAGHASREALRDAVALLLLLTTRPTGAQS